MKTLYLPTKFQHQISKHCENSYPLEACGLLISWGDNVVTNIIPSPNMAEHPAKNFEIDPALILQHQKESRLGHDKILGHYHSHPDGKALPSDQDQAQNHDPDLIWVIVQVTGGVALGMKAFATDPESGKLTAIAIDQS